MNERNEVELSWVEWNDMPLYAPNYAFCNVISILFILLHSAKFWSSNYRPRSNRFKLLRFFASLFLSICASFLFTHITYAILIVKLFAECCSHNMRSKNVFKNYLSSFSTASWSRHLPLQKGYNEKSENRYGVTMTCNCITSFCVLLNLIDLPIVSMVYSVYKCAFSSELQESQFLFLHDCVMCGAVYCTVQCTVYSAYSTHHHHTLYTYFICSTATCCCNIYLPCIEKNFIISTSNKLYVKWTNLISTVYAIQQIYRQYLWQRQTRTVVLVHMLPIQEYASA